MEIDFVISYNGSKTAFLPTYIMIFLVILQLFRMGFRRAYIALPGTTNKPRSCPRVLTTNHINLGDHFELSSNIKKYSAVKGLKTTPGGGGGGH